jgi:putative transposase
MESEPIIADRPRMVDTISIPVPGTSALRHGRYSAPNHVYHVTTCTYMRRAVLTSFCAARTVIDQFRREEESGRAETIAFVVMPDHFHWLLRLSGRHSLSHTVNNVKSFSARQINLQRRRSGPIWQRGFHDHGIRREEDLAATARYIVANPLRAGLVDSLGDYPHWDAIWA